MVIYSPWSSVSVRKLLAFGMFRLSRETRSFMPETAWKGNVQHANDVVPVRDSVITHLVEALAAASGSLKPARSAEFSGDSSRPTGRSRTDSARWDLLC